MNIIEPTVEVWKQGEGLQGMYEHIERCARVCYRSENKGNVTAEKFVKGLIKRNELRPLEFGTVKMKYPANQSLEEVDFYPWMRFTSDDSCLTNLRVLVESAPNWWEGWLKEECVWDEDVTTARPTVHWNISRGIADEFRTHVMLSSIMESTRYVNYGKKDIEVIRPTWLPADMASEKAIWQDSIKYSINAYKMLLAMDMRPEQARGVLPLDLATNLVQCGFMDAWDNFFDKRCDRHAHPDSQCIAKKAQELINS